MKRVYLCSGILMYIIMLGCNDKKEGPQDKTNPNQNEKVNALEEELSIEKEDDQGIEFRQALNITLASNLTYLEGAIGETPVYIKYIKNDEGSGARDTHYFYPNNGTCLPLVANIDEDFVVLHRMKEGEVRETFDLIKTKEGFKGRWEKEEQVKPVEFKKLVFTNSQQQYFKDYLIQHVLDNLLDLWSYEPEDFSNLVLNNGFLTYQGGDGGTTGRTSFETFYQAIEINPQGDSWFLFVDVELNESWHSMDEIENGAKQEDLIEENTHAASITLYRLVDGKATEVDYFSVFGNWDLSVTVGQKYVVLESDKEKNVFVWNGDTKRLEKK